MDEFTSRRAPQNLEAEQSVIGSMILDSRCVPDVIELLRADDFFLKENREIFETLHHMFSMAQPIDPITLLDRMEARGVRSDSSENYIKQLLEITPSAANVKYYAEIVRDKALLRAVGTAANEIDELVYSGEDDAAHVLDAAEQKVYDIRQGRTLQQFRPIGEVLTDVYDNLNQLALLKGELPGLTTGFPQVDMITTGLNKSDLIIIAARPGMGKTSIALNMAMAAAKKSNTQIVFFSLEMSAPQLVTRMLSTESLIDSNKLLTGNLSPDDWNEIAPASERLAKMGIMIDDNPAITPTEMKAKCRRLKNLGLVIIDYMQLMTTGAKRSENRVQEVSEISRSLKIMAKELNVPVVCLSQLSRANEKRPDKRPVLSDIRESGSIEQDADVIMMLYRDDYYDKDRDAGASTVAKFEIAKNRHGRTGTVELQWVPQYTMFTQIESRRDDY